LSGGALYLAMELLEGRALSEVLEQEGQLAPGRALHILAHILRGLAHVHAAGLIHRDMKPENIFLVRQDDDVDFAKILDFGIAKPMKGELTDDNVKLTQAGMAFGTPIYMAPEQALGNPLDGRADLYAAAVMAYEMLCGQPPFYSEDKLAVMSMHTARPVPAMRTRLIKGGKPVPSSIERLIARGLTKKPSDRYATAEEFLAKVEQALSTPDGGQTDVNFERVSSTGSQPLVSASGHLQLGDEADVGPSPDGQDVTNLISTAIDEVLRTPAAPLPAAQPPRSTAARTPNQPAPPSPAPPQPPLPPVISARPPVAPAAKAGVGLGLPYTGPQGEPIFGLTPEQRLAGTTPPAAAPVVAVPPPAKKKRWPLYAGIVGLAVVVGIVIAIATSPRRHAAVDTNSPAGRAQQLFDQGSLEQAIELVERGGVALRTDAAAQLVLGNAYAARGQRKDALAAYDRTLRLAPELETDQTLRASLRGMTAPDVKDLAMLVEAFDLWIGHTQDPAARTQLDANAVSDSRFIVSSVPPAASTCP
ncbi:MAG: protein kinase, partial [Proteobacteria bacterium]|nr:protein kinase [Pseudomonadota bacterium]